jgi:hypothetical protein
MTTAIDKNAKPTGVRSLDEFTLEELAAALEERQRQVLASADFTDQPAAMLAASAQLRRNVSAIVKNGLPAGGVTDAQLAVVPGMLAECAQNLRAVRRALHPELVNRRGPRKSTAPAAPATPAGGAPASHPADDGDEAGDSDPGF